MDPLVGPQLGPVSGPSQGWAHLAPLVGPDCTQYWARLGAEAAPVAVQNLTLVSTVTLDGRCVSSVSETGPDTPVYPVYLTVTNQTLTYEMCIQCI